MPIKIDANTYGNDLFRLTNILLPSLKKFFNLRQLKELLIIAPADECSRINDAIAPFCSDIRCRVISEDALLGKMRGWTRHRRYIDVSSFLKKKKTSRLAQYLLRRIGNRKTWLQLSGWYRQQVIKLCAATVIKTRYYITCDADLCLTRPLDCSVLFPEGKAILSREQIRVHHDWWDASARMLKIPLCLQAHDTGMSVTPEILSTDVVKRLLRHLASKGRAEGYPTIFDYLSNYEGWTEHQLYWIYLSYFYKSGDYYATGSATPSLIDIDNSVWYASDLQTQNALPMKVRQAFENPNSVFMAVQTNSVPAQDYAEAVRDYLI